MTAFGMHGHHKDDNQSSSKVECSECALNRAVLMRRTDLVRVLCENGAKTDVPLAGGVTILHVALTYLSHVEIIKCLLKANACLDTLNKSGQTPVYSALCLSTSSKILTWLELVLEAGYRVTQQDYDKAIERFTDSDGEAIQMMLKSYLTEPRTLQESCRFTLRRILGPRVTQVGCLPLPEKCKKFINLENVLQNHRLSNPF